VADIDTQACHKTVNFLRYFEETHSAEKPNEYAACYGFFSFFDDLGLDIFFCNCMNRSGKRSGEKDKQKDTERDNLDFFRRKPSLD